MSDHPELDHQEYQPFPKLESAFATVDVDGVRLPVELSYSWYFLLIRLWQIVCQNGRLGYQDAVTMASTGAGNLTATNVATGQPVQNVLAGTTIDSLIAEILQLATPPDPPLPSSPGGSDVGLLQLVVPPDPPGPSPDLSLLELVPPASPEPDLLTPIMIAEMNSIALG